MFHFSLQCFIFDLSRFTLKTSGGKNQNIKGEISFLGARDFKTSGERCNFKGEIIHETLTYIFHSCNLLKIILL